jgi:hypothetical protein
VARNVALDLQGLYDSKAARKAHTGGHMSGLTAFFRMIGDTAQEYVVTAPFFAAEDVGISTKGSSCQVSVNLCADWLGSR